MNKFLPGLNEHYRSVGKTKIPKKSFKTRDDAWRAINMQNEKSTATAYKCSICGNWHIGH